MLTIDDNEIFTSLSGGIAKACKECKLSDPLHQHHDEIIEEPSHINGSERIYFIFVKAKLLPFVKTSGFTTFNELTNFDHKGLSTPRRQHETNGHRPRTSIQKGSTL